MNINEQVERATKWFMALDPKKQERVVGHLFDHAILSEWVGLFDQETAEELAEESGEPVDKYLAPYFRTCGEALDEPF